MSKLIRERWTALAAGFTGNLGVCAFCMRTSFAAAAFSWICLLAAMRIGLSGVTIFVAAIAAILTALWIAHLATRALRIARAEGVDQARRNSLIAFARGFALTAAATAIPAALARAQAGCQAGSLACLHTYSCLNPDGSVHCCPADAPFLCTTTCECLADISECSSYYKCTGQ